MEKRIITKNVCLVMISNTKSLLEKSEQIIRHHKEIEKIKGEGLSVGDNQELLLKKIEELTLYLMEKDKQLIEQKAAMEKLELRLSLIEKNIQKKN